MTFEEYLAIERPAEFRHEYCEGRRFQRPVSTADHCLITTNIAAALWTELRGSEGEVFLVDMRVLVPTRRMCAYPDIAATNGRGCFDDDLMDTLIDPIMIAEVVAPTTEAYDRGRKFEHYRTIESLREYLLISSDRVHADLFTKQPDGNWLLTSATRLEDTVELHSIDARLKLTDVYEKVEFASNGT